MSRTLSIPELDALDPPIALPGDELHPMDPEPFSTRWYDWEGRPLGDELDASMERYGELRWREGAVRRTTLMLESGEIAVSTAYLGIDHGYFRSREPRPPIIWETMIFWDSWQDEYQWRYATRPAAMANHDKVVEILCRYFHTTVADEVGRIAG